MRWETEGERVEYDSPWVRLRLVRVREPGRDAYDHHVIDAPHAAGVVAADPDRGVLLLWRHRFITDTWGWEVPAGMIEPGETAEEAARRELREETGHEPGPLTPILAYHPVNGLSSQRFHLFAAAGAVPLGRWAGSAEAERVEWVARETIPDLLRTGEIVDGLSVCALSSAIVLGFL